MALSSTLGLRRLLRASPSSLPQWKWPFSPVRQSSSFPLDDATGGGNLPPLTTPKLFVSGLSRLTTDEKLREAFSAYGQLLEAKVVTDRVSGRSKGFGFVRFATIEEADKARHGMNAKFLDGWVIFVDPAKPREPKPPRPPEPEPSETGIRTNKTIGWCG
ncbi:organelle RRM domain-containing protein 2, mitochondrial [Phoenix dactylifera]|uniref:Organelle RRM domain-containing protein 2, mitochondrial n=1 Tax=Phoenix dactylifera TaxID=42345 RepID=A0A8B7CA93_PHODC|nr:organelle RRM domain-containing protein 2, mitochondrial [Phoenix dactylifera]